MGISQASKKRPRVKGSIPLCIDLDGTLVNTDMFWESLLVLLKGNIFFVLVLPIWMIKGKAYCKGQIARRVSLDIPALPYHSSLLDFVKEERKGGRSVILATGTHYLIANKISEHLKCFDQVVASSDLINFTGKRKSRFLTSHFGKGGFDYAGNSRVDLPIWENAKGAIVVNGTPKLIEAVREVTLIYTIFPKPNQTT